jgi:DNA gyrase inhibitor
MAYTVKQVDKRTIAGFHLVGPWDVTVKKASSN